METGSKIVAVMEGMVDNMAPNLIDAMIAASDRVESLEDQLEDAEKQRASSEKFEKIQAILKSSRGGIRRSDRKVRRERLLRNFKPAPRTKRTRLVQGRRTARATDRKICRQPNNSVVSCR